MREAGVVAQVCFQRISFYPIAIVKKGNQVISVVVNCKIIIYDRVQRDESEYLVKL